MQFAKEDIRQRILTAAKQEFLKKGFDKASIRTIAAEAGTAKSNLHNYFKDKDALFLAAVSPAVAEIRRGLNLAAGRNAEARVGSYTSEGQSSAIRAVSAFVARNGDAVRLLLFGAGGSSLAGFKAEAIEGFTDVLFGWFAAAAPGKAPSRLFVRCVASFYVTGLEQILIEGAGGEKSSEYIGEFQAFVYGGWSALLRASSSGPARSNSKQ